MSFLDLHWKNIKYIWSKETFSSFKSAEIAKKNCKKPTKQTNNQNKDRKKVSLTFASKLICISFDKCLELRTRGYSCVNREHFRCVSIIITVQTQAGKTNKTSRLGIMPSTEQKMPLRWKWSANLYSTATAKYRDKTEDSWKGKQRKSLFKYTNICDSCKQEYLNEFWNTFSSYWPMPTVQ